MEIPISDDEDSITIINSIKPIINWKVLDIVKCPFNKYTKFYRKALLKNYFHGNFKIYKSNQHIYCRCSFHHNCNTKIRFSYNLEMDEVVLEINQNCDDSKPYNTINGTVIINQKVYKKVYEYLVNGVSKDAIRKLISSEFKIKSLEIIDKVISKEKRNIKNKSLNLNIREDRSQFFNEIYIHSQIQFDNLKETNFITLSSEIEEHQQLNKYDNIVFTSKELISQNLSKIMKNESIQLTLDGTFKTINSGKVSNTDWTLIVLGSAIVEWDLYRKKWKHTFKPILFAITRSETKKGTISIFEGFIKACGFLGYSRSSVISKVKCVTSDMSLAFQGASKIVFTNAVIISCWAHVIRRPFESYASKNSILANDYASVLQILQESRSEDEYYAHYEYCKKYLNSKYEANCSDKIQTICESFNFRFVTKLPGLSKDTQTNERFNRSLNNMSVLRSNGSLFLSHGVKGVLELASKFIDETRDYKFQATNDHYERDMLIQANKLSFESFINIKKIHINKKIHNIRYRDVTTNPKWNYVDLETNITDNLFEFSGKLILISDRHYFNENSDGYHICRIVDKFETRDDYKKEHANLAGVSAFHSKTNKIFIKECFVFKIICDLTGKCFDPDGRYCIDRKQLNHALIRSALPRSVLEKKKIDFKILENLNNNQIKILIEHLFKTNKNKTNEYISNEDQIYLVNRSSFIGIEIDNKRIEKSNNSIKGKIEEDIDTNTNFDLNHLKKCNSFRTVRFNEKANKMNCDCCVFSDFAVCSHVLAVSDSIGAINLNDLLNVNKCIVSNDLRSNIGKCIKKYMFNPITQTSGNFSGKIIKIVRNRDGSPMYKVQFSTHAIYIDVDEIKYYL